MLLDEFYTHLVFEILADFQWCLTLFIFGIEIDFAGF